jgi:hypothetical protein
VFTISKRQRTPKSNTDVASPKEIRNSSNLAEILAVKASEDTKPPSFVIRLLRAEEGSNNVLM